ncbi:TAXI family TRAP transporter solute-binding subunit [Rhodospirillales bacterium]|nr:TAXI family TRAP transporter solute-binding subunit [Rhodospirillales bacterium]
MRRWILGLFVMSLAFTALDVRANDPVVIGTGGETGVYYATGKILCQLFESKDIPCEARTSGGSIANLKALAAGEITLAMVQSDWQFHAYRGSSDWDGKKIEDMRSVFSIYPEPMQIVTKRDANISKWNALKGKRINVGNTTSGHRKTFEEMVPPGRWKSWLGEVYELPSNEQVAAFCQNKFDAFIYNVGIPNGDMRRAVAECNGLIIGPQSSTIRKMATAARPYFVKVVIPAGTYRPDQPAVKTFGVMATLVTRSDLDAKVLNALVDAVFGDIDSFKKRHPAYAHIDPKVMATEGLSAPLHPAAQAYYQQKGMLH